MPVKEYYKGSGSKVMKSMKERYGKERGERIFYATAKEKGMEPERKSKKALDGLKKAHKR